jgi:hypothetical protein
MNDKNNKQSVRIRKGSRLLCREHGIQTMLHQDENDQCFLECRCKRTPRLLDPHKGCISLEHAMANPSDPLVRRLFPIVDANGFRPRGRDITDVLDDVGMQAKREAWAA